MDEFAQTRGADDLFDDDFTPIEAPVPQRVENASTQSNPQPQRSARNDRAIRGQANHIPRQPRQLRTQPPSLPPKTAASEDPNRDIENSSANQDLPPQNEKDPDPTLPPQQLKPPSAVRGDRTLTGGTLKPKLTEDELSARLAAAKLNNAKRAEAHRLAEADEANFQQREAQASQKRKEEGAARRAMNQEREKNRMRKLGAQGGREWDEGKAEQVPERGGQYRRGANGGIGYDPSASRGEYQDRKANEFRERKEGFVPRAGGRGRGDRGRGGRGRGAYAPNQIAQQRAPDPVNDFPALPTASKTQAPPSSLPTSEGKEQRDQQQFSGKTYQNVQPAAGGESWADQVDRVQEVNTPARGR